MIDELVGEDTLIIVIRWENNWTDLQYSDMLHYWVISIRLLRVIFNLLTEVKLHIDCLNWFCRCL